MPVGAYDGERVNVNSQFLGQIIIMPNNIKFGSEFSKPQKLSISPMGYIGERGGGGG